MLGCFHEIVFVELLLTIRGCLDKKTTESKIRNNTVQSEKIIMNYEISIWKSFKILRFHKIQVFSCLFGNFVYTRTHMHVKLVQD